MTVWDNAAVYIWLDNLKLYADLHPASAVESRAQLGLCAHEQPIQLTDRYTTQVMQMKAGSPVTTFADNFNLPQSRR